MAELTEFSTAELVDFFHFLDELRESGQTNMYGASPYIERQFDLEKDEADCVVLAWMRTFSHSDTVPDRVTAALSSELTPTDTLATRDS